MKRNNFFSRFIVVTLTAALLLVSGSRAISVKAVGTTAAIAGTAFVLTGAVYLSYIALTNGQVAMPLADDMHDWLGNIGRKVSQYPSGAAAYQDIYQGLLRDPAANVIDGVWTWTQDRIKLFVNDFSDTRIMQDIVSYEQMLDFVPPALPFDYGEVTQMPLVYDFYGSMRTITDPIYPTGLRVIRKTNQSTRIIPTTLTGEYRNVYRDGRYYAEKYVNGTWSQVNLTSVNATVFEPDDDKYIPAVNTYYTYVSVNQNVSIGSEFTVPVFPDLPLYNYATGETTEVIPQSQTEVVNTPQWIDPDNNNRPIIPWVPIPDIPTGVPVPSGYTGTPQWGFNLQDLLDKLEDLAGQLIDIGGIASLINDFAGLHGDNYYLEYNDGDTNYYTYYQPTIFDNDNEYVTYNINVSEQEDIIPVDLNTISLYTDNTYLERVKEHARNAGDIFANYVAFWHNCDSDLVYTMFGAAILVLVGAFVGKWGHS